MSRREPLDLAIVGLACRFPGAPDLPTFWQNILAKVDATTDVPPDRRDPAVFFDPGSPDHDRVPCRRGGYLDAPVPSDPASRGIMTLAVDGGDPESSLLLDAARKALLDAGLGGGVLDGRRVEVVIGRGNDFNRGNLTRLQHGRIAAQTLAILESLHPEWSEADRQAVRADLKASLPPFGPATVPGQLTNATAGLVADRLGLTGASFAVDVAGASSLVALDLASRSLASRRSDLAIVGGVYLEADVDFPMDFSQVGALSRSGRSRPFSAGADGMLTAEGVGVVILKRRPDAERDGDRIYAVLKGVGVAGDVRGPGLAAPGAWGQARAIRRAYHSSGIDPASVGLIEGRGLGVPAADRAEIRAIRAIFPPARPGRRALGAVSSMIGHALPAAGIAGLIKAALALHHRVLPPTLLDGDPHPLLRRVDSPATLNTETRPWIHGDSATPRRAGVNAFGLAGIDAHAVLEEHAASADRPGAMPRWDSEAILIGAPDRPALVARSRALLAWLGHKPSTSLKDVAATLGAEASAHPARLGLVARDLDDLAVRLEAALKRLEDPGCRSIRDARGAYFRDRPDGDPAPPVAFLFPGEGSQYHGMLADLCPHFPEVRALFDTSDRLAREAGEEIWPSERLFAPRGDQDPALWSAVVAVNVVLSSQWALYQLLSRLGLRADAVLGHSSGEILALAAAGVIGVDRPFEDRVGALGGVFGRLEASGEIPKARLVAVATDRARVEAMLGDSGVEVAMDNCPHQVVLAGEPGATAAVVARLHSAGISTEDLPFERAYHTPGFAPAVGPIRAFFDDLELSGPTIPVYSCASEGRMPGEPGAIRDLAVAQWTRPVGFRRAVEAMHADGLRVFVDVGARGNLAGFVEDTLRSKSAFAVAANLPRRSGLLQLNHLVASLYAQGVDLDSAHLYARRSTVAVDFAAPVVPDRAVPALAIGFPTMRLSEAMVERLRKSSRPPAAEVALTGHHPAQSNGRHHLNGSNGYAPVEPVAAPPPDDATATMLGFQETMDAFLRTQQEVMGAYLGEAPAHDPFDLGLGELDEPPGDAGPWAGDLLSIVPGVEATSRIVLEVEGDPVAENHTLGGRRISAVHPEWRGLPVLPFSVMAEILAEAAGRLAPGRVLVGLRDVRAHRWVRYEPEPVTLEVRARVDPDRPDLVAVSIHNRGTLRGPRPIEAAVFEGIVEFGRARPEPPMARPFVLDDPGVCRFTPGSIYGEQWLFHGPALRAVVGIGPIATGGIEGTLRVLPLAPLLREGQGADRLRTDPIILDNFTHLLGGWGLDRLADDGDVIFPLRMDHLALLGEAPPEGSDVSCRVAIVERERHRVRVEADIVGPDGRTWMEIRGWEDWRFHWPARYRDGFRQPDRTLLGEPLAIPGRPDVSAVWLEPPADMGRPVWRDVLEHVQLGPDERADYLALPGPDARRTHRLWGRIAAKEAVRRLWLAEGRPPTYPADLIVERDPEGRPRLRSRLEPGRDDLPAVSIAQVEGVAVALACRDASAAVGIDVETIVERPSSFEDAAFLPGERAFLGDRAGLDRAEWVARFWTAKEATAKATGLGFVDGPAGVEVVAIGSDGELAVRLRGGLAAACPELAGNAIRATSIRRGDWIWTWTLGERIE